MSCQCQWIQRHMRLSLPKNDHSFSYLLNLLYSLHYPTFWSILFPHGNRGHHSHLIRNSRHSYQDILRTSLAQLCRINASFWRLVQNCFCLLKWRSTFLKYHLLFVSRSSLSHGAHNQINIQSSLHCVNFRPVIACLSQYILRKQNLPHSLSRSDTYHGQRKHID